MAQSPKMAPLNLPKFDIIQRLPAELQLDIYDLLSYNDAIILSQVNRHFHTTVHPQRWPAEDKVEFVLKAQLFPRYDGWRELDSDERRKLDTEISNLDSEDYTVSVTDKFGFACLKCYRVKSMEAFSTSQVRYVAKRDQPDHPGWLYSRCCIDCSIARKSLRHGMEVAIILKMLKHDPRFTYYHCVNSLTVRESRRMKYCEKCEALHTQDEWDNGTSETTGIAARTMAHIPARWETRSAIETFKAAKRTHDMLVDPTIYKCTVCRASAPELWRNDFFCPKCFSWVCHNCCWLGPGHRHRARCRGAGGFHDLVDGRSFYEAYKHLAQERRQSTAHDLDVACGEQHVLADVFFMNEAGQGY